VAKRGEMPSFTGFFVKKASAIEIDRSFSSLLNYPYRRQKNDFQEIPAAYIPKINYDKSFQPQKGDPS